MRTLALTILTMGIVLAAGNARAQTYDPAFPFCMHVVYPRGATYQDCTYYTMAQCAASASGRGLQCDPNPYYAGPTASVRRNDRRYRQVGSISPAPAGTVQDKYCLQGRPWGYPGNCHVLQLRPMHGHRERYCFLLRDQSPVLVRAPAERRLSGPILSGSDGQPPAKALGARCSACTCRGRRR